MTSDAMVATSGDGVAAESRRAGADTELQLASRPLGGDLFQTELSVPDIHCGACIRRVETTLSALPGVSSARVNLSTKRATVTWRQANGAPPLMAALKAVGYPAHLLDPGPEAGDKRLTGLILATAVAGFAAANIMLLSVSIWSGADGATRDLFHWISAAIAFPALAYAGQPFFLAAWNALRHGRTNMDVPITIGVVLAFGLSLYETVTHGEHAYFDASITLLFFLLIGRTLDHMMRERARTAVVGLMRLSPRGATVVGALGETAFVAVAEIEPGMTVLVPAGERIPVDGIVEMGGSDIDCAIVTGESVPQRAGAGSPVRAGILNLTGPLRVRATARADGSFIAEMVRLMEAAEDGRARYRRLADRVAQYYSPVVHLTALLTLVGWVAATGDWHRAISIAIAVLIITCPCALGLAVPIVQVVGARRLFEQGIMVKDGSAIERLTEIDMVVFDKTGTLTIGASDLANAEAFDPADLALAAAIATHSRHPVSRGIAAAVTPIPPVAFISVTEVPGAGLEARTAEATYRLGRADWAQGQAAESAGGIGGPVLVRDGVVLGRFAFKDRPRRDTAETVRTLRGMGFDVELLSGDEATIVASTAAEIGIESWQAGVLPARKTERLDALAASGRKVLMVGDGLNDAPALAAAHVSMAPGNAVDVGRNAADFVFLKESLGAIPVAIDVARRADRLMRQNLTLAIAYNAIAVPIAVFGYVTPLIAALAMSLSSILVVSNALRLRPRKPEPADALRVVQRAPGALP